MVTNSIKTSKKNLPWTLTHYHHNYFKILFYWFVGTYSWSIRNCHNSSALLKVPGCYILEFCLHINLCPPLPQSPMLESYSCPEVPKLRQGLLNDWSQPPHTTTYHHCHQEAVPLVVACLASSFATWKENIPECISGESLHDPPHPPNRRPPPARGNLFSRNEFQVASFKAHPLQTPGTICYGIGRVTGYSHLDRHPSLQEDMCVFSLVSSLALSCFLNCSHIYPASKPALPVWISPPSIRRETIRLVSLAHLEEVDKKAQCHLERGTQSLLLDWLIDWLKDTPFSFTSL